ncbi:hypothetical protein PR003_g8062 [Phytophthora rubi]|uniref:Uncharacterized protein n=1 Tax=Phytophthora rubi TaxID=129364 RepID=A0A6A4FKJ3_9STRA|nr:hypothetical protein PR002_g17637 [Phytophthora rubi]KAE9005844.1 hypothetical protein PR001_g17347 [Phytophthora rubi]KAE9345192.1 hypothetical protein PR003_g8062 [Phytophthora rubi]
MEKSIAGRGSLTGILLVGVAVWWWCCSHSLLFESLTHAKGARPAYPNRGVTTRNPWLFATAPLDFTCTAAAATWMSCCQHLHSPLTHKNLALTLVFALKIPTQHRGVATRSSKGFNPFKGLTLLLPDANCGTLTPTVTTLMPCVARESSGYWRTGSSNSTGECRLTGTNCAPNCVRFDAGRRFINYFTNHNPIKNADKGIYK